MLKKEITLGYVRYEVALEIIALQISLAINLGDKRKIKKLMKEQLKIYAYDEKTIEKVLDVYGSEIKNKLKSGD